MNSIKQEYNKLVMICSGGEVSNKYLTNPDLLEKQDFSKYCVLPEQAEETIKKYRQLLEYEKQWDIPKIYLAYI